MIQVGPIYHKKGVLKGGSGRQKSQSQREMWRGYAAGFEDGGRGWGQGMQVPLDVRKVKETDSF